MKKEEVELFKNVVKTLVDNDEIPSLIYEICNQIDKWENIPLRFASYPIVKTCKALNLTIGPIRVLDEKWEQVVKMCILTESSGSKLKPSEIVEMKRIKNSDFGIDLTQFIKPNKTKSGLFDHQ